MCPSRRSARPQVPCDDISVQRGALVAPSSTSWYPPDVFSSSMSTAATGLQGRTDDLHEEALPHEPGHRENKGDAAAASLSPPFPGSLPESVPPRPPPRPANAWILYRSARAHELKASAEYASLPQAEISKVIGQLWRDESPESRRHWELEAERAKALHREKYPDYVYRPIRRARKKVRQEEAAVGPAPQPAPPEHTISNEFPSVLQPLSDTPPGPARHPHSPANSHELNSGLPPVASAPHLQYTELWPDPTMQVGTMEGTSASSIAWGTALSDAQDVTAPLWPTTFDAVDPVPRFAPQVRADGGPVHHHHQQRSDTVTTSTSLAFSAPSAFETAFYPSLPQSTVLEGFDDTWLQAAVTTGSDENPELC